jgi:hypothetical protein
VWETPDPAEELRVEDVASPFPALHEPEVAGTARQVEEDDGVCARDAVLEDRELHRVDHPRVFVGVGVQLRLPRRFRLEDPVAVDDLVRVDDGQIEDRAERVRDVRLAGAAAADDRYAAETASASSRGSLRETICEIPSPPIVTP